MAIAEGHKQNFEMLRRAMLAGDAVLLECQLVDTGQPAAVICAVSRSAVGTMEFVPFAAMFSGDPYQQLNPPNPDGGFFPQEEVRG